MRAVLDPNVIIAGLLSPGGAPAAILAAWRDGAFELVVSPALLDELRRALAYPKLRRRLQEADTERVIEWLQASALIIEDPVDYPLAARSRDAGDDYLLALAATARSALVSGDADLLELGEELPILAPAAYLAQLSR